MYENKNASIDWLKIILKVVICILIFLLVLKLISVFMNNKKEKETENIMNNNLKNIQSKISKNLKDDMIPKNIGDKNKYTFKELEKVIGEIKDENGEKCNYDDSYVEIIKLDKELQVKVLLSCLNKEDYSNNFIQVKEKTTKKPTKKETTTTKKTTVKKTTTTSKKETTTITTKKITTTKPSNDLTIGFNVGIGDKIDVMKVEIGKNYQLPTPVLEGYKFVGWYLEDTKYDIISIDNKLPFKKCILDGDSYNNCLVLKAKWIKN